MSRPLVEFNRVPMFLELVLDMRARVVKLLERGASKEPEIEALEGRDLTDDDLAQENATDQRATTLAKVLRRCTFADPCGNGACPICQHIQAWIMVGQMQEACEDMGDASIIGVAPGGDYGQSDSPGTHMFEIAANELNAALATAGISRCIGAWHVRHYPSPWFMPADRNWQPVLWAIVPRGEVSQKTLRRLKNALPMPIRGCEAVEAIDITNPEVACHALVEPNFSAYPSAIVDEDRNGLGTLHAETLVALTVALSMASPQSRLFCHGLRPAGGPEAPQRHAKAKPTLHWF